MSPARAYGQKASRTPRRMFCSQFRAMGRDAAGTFATSAADAVLGDAEAGRFVAGEVREQAL